MTLDNERAFKMLKEQNEGWYIENMDYIEEAGKMPDVIEILPQKEQVPNIEDLEKDLIIPNVEKIEVEPLVQVVPEIKFNTLDYSEKMFKERLKDWSQDQLEAFAKDKRKNISQIAQKQLMLLKKKGY